MYSIREEGAHTSWASGRYSDRLGLYIKYPRELYATRIARAVLLGGGWTRWKFSLLNGAERVRSSRVVTPVRRVLHGVKDWVRSRGRRD